MGLVHFIFVLFLVYNKPRFVSSICSSVYGAKPCPFIPSPPGEAPPCAKPGLTYCEYPEHYPRDLIHHLIEKWKYDHSTLLLDESKHDLNNFFMASDTKHPSVSYGLPHNNIHPTDMFYPDARYGSNHFHGYPSNSYIPVPRNNTFNPFRSSQTGSIHHQLNSYKYSSKIPYVQSTYHRYSGPQYYKSVGVPEINRHQSNPWNGDKYYNNRRKRSLRKWRGSNFTETVKRSKRQAGATGQTLCQSRSQYIMPRAALNNKGDWMYVVNLPEVDSRYTQLVKSETCVSQQCSNLCALPNGYSSRCEQKYVQKRLVAVEAGGSQLYSDVFWFPSCCVCTILNT